MKYSILIVLMIKLKLMGLFRNLRFYILLTSSLIAGGIYFYIKSNFQGNEPQIIKLTQIYALLSLSYLYIALLATPLTRFFTFMPFRAKYIFARRAIGVSAFMFALLHSYFAFFGQLGGFTGLAFLNSRYLIAITLSATALAILSLMAATSFEWVINKLSYRRWKTLHRLVYLAVLLAVIHGLILGSHFADLSGLIPQIFSIALAFLIVLEALRFDNYLSYRLPYMPRVGLTFFLISIGIGIVVFLTLAPSDLTSSLSLHEAHRKLAAEAQKGTTVPDALKNIPGMQGDRSKRYSVDVDFPELINPGTPANLKFRVFDATNGAPVTLFTRNYEKLLHLIVVDNDLNNFQHIHPEFKDGWFEIAATFPHEGRFHIYLDFLPTGAIEQQFAFPLNVGESDIIESSKVQTDENRIFTTGNYNITLSYDKTLKASELSLGSQNLNFKITELNGNPVTNLKPYLGSFGHLVMINTKTYDYLHVHPYQIGNLQPDQNGGPEVSFMPMGIYGPIKPGLYKLFAQFNPNNNLIVSEFIVKVE